METNVVGNGNVAELKISIPALWLSFLEECYQITGIDREEDLQDNMRAHVVMLIDGLNAKDKIRLVKKYNLMDIYEIFPSVYEMAADIPEHSRRPRLKHDGEALVKAMRESLTDAEMNKIYSHLTKTSIFCRRDYV